MNVFVTINVHKNVHDNCVRSIYLCIPVYNCMHVCHLLYVVNVLSEEGTGVIGGYEDGTKIYYRRKRPGVTGGTKTWQNILLEEETVCDRRVQRRCQFILILIICDKS